MNTQSRRKLTWKAFREAVTFFAGLAGAFHQTVVAAQADPWLLALFASMMGGVATVNSIALAIASRGSSTESSPQSSVGPGGSGPSSQP